jgi:hypothetical protein
MKILFHLTFLIILFPSYCYPDTIIPYANQIILMTCESKTWNPTKKETQKALTAIYDFLDNPEKFLDDINVWTTDTEYLKVK